MKWWAWVPGLVSEDGEGGSKLPWILLLIAIGGAVYAGVLAASQAEEAREAKEQAEQAREVADSALQAMEERQRRLPIIVDSINTFWRDRFDSIAILPPELPPQDPRLRAYLDTIRVNRELRLAIDAQTQRLQSVQAQNVELRATIVNLRTEGRRVIDSLTVFWMAEVADRERVITQITTALEAAEEEADRWEKAYYADRMSIWDKLVWGGGGFLAGYLTNEFTGGGGSSEVTVVTGTYDSLAFMPPLVVDPHTPVACSNWGRKGYC